MCMYFLSYIANRLQDILFLDKAILSNGYRRLKIKITKQLINQITACMT